MKLASLLLSLVALTSCRQELPIPHKYLLGSKVLLKTGDVAVIIDYPLFDTYYKGSPQPIAQYEVRVAYSKTINKTSDIIDGVKLRVTDVGTFWISEFEIEKLLQ